MSLELLPPELLDHLASLLPLATKAALWDASSVCRPSLARPGLYPHLTTQQLLASVHLNGLRGLASYLLATGLVDCNETSHSSHTCTQSYSCQGKSCLQLASSRGWSVAVALLLDCQGIQTNWRDRWGKTALHRAVEEDHLDVVSQLLAHPHTDPNCQDNMGLTPLHLAVMLDLPHFLPLLLSHPSTEPDRQDVGSGHSPLHLAAREGNLHLAQILLQHPRVSGNLQDLAGRSALHLACWQGNLAMVELLLGQEEVDLELATLQEGDTVYHSACLRDCVEIVACLLQHRDLQPDLLNRGGSSGLHLAVWEGHNMLVATILRARRWRQDIDINLQGGCRRMTPLHLACERGREDLVGLLLGEQGVQLDRREEGGKTVLDMEVKPSIRLILMLAHAHAHAAVESGT